MVVETLFPTADVVAQWHDLAKRALVPNLFYEPEFAQAAAIPFGQGVRLATVWGMERGQRRLLLAWPFKVERARWGLPLGVMLGWRHPFSSLGVPLLDPEHAEDALTCLLRIGDTIPSLPRLALLQLVPEEGVFANLLHLVTGREDIAVDKTERHDRPYWKRGQADDPMLSLSSGTRSKLRQEYRRLERDGAVRHDIITDPLQLPAALDDYLDLEASGWKARMGTAIPQSPKETAFMRQLHAELGKAGRIRFDRLRIGNTTLASSITYLNDSHAWYAKISFNEAYAKNSPGSQLVLKVTEDFRVNTTIRYVDSCAPAGHPLMRKFWSDRFYLSNVLVGMSGNNLQFRLGSAFERLRPQLRDAANRARRFIKRIRPAANTP